MNLQELISKALEAETLAWWLKHPELQSFFLRYSWASSDEGEYWMEQEESKFLLKTDSQPLPYEDEDDIDYSDYSVSAYPCKREGEIYERIYRPYDTDAEIQARINTILGGL
jgi:hypothetical protein